MRPPGTDQGERAELSGTMPAGRRLVLVCVVWSLCALLSEAYVFSLLLSNPVVETAGDLGRDGDLRPAEEDAEERERGPDPRPGHPRLGRVELDPVQRDHGGDLRSGRGRLRTMASLDDRRPGTMQERDADVDVSLQLAVSVSSDRGPAGGVSRPSCRTDRQCGRGHYCHAERQRCRRRARPGAACSRDAMCRGRSSSCRQGRCIRRRRHHKEPVSQCRSDADCDAASCCARLDSGTACRPRTPVGHRCRATPADLPVPIYATCPCVSGARCKYVHHPGETWTLWTAYDNLRCVKKEPEVEDL